MKQLKRMLACVIAAAVAIPTVAASLPATAAEQDSSISMVDKFRNPDNQAQGMFRFWLPDASVDQSVLEAHFKAIQEAGFSGVEIAHVPYSRVEGCLLYTSIIFWASVCCSIIPTCWRNFASATSAY